MSAAGYRVAALSAPVAALSAPVAALCAPVAALCAPVAAPGDSVAPSQTPNHYARPAKETR